MPSAAATACRAWSASSSGAFQNAMIASPIYLSIVPPSASTTPDSGLSSRFISAVSRSGSSFSVSEMVVKPRTSLNRIDKRLALAAEMQLRRVGGEPLHQDRRQILREGAHDAAPQPPLGRVVAGALCGGHRDEGDRRRDRRHVEPAEMQEQEARRDGSDDGESRERGRQPSGPAPDRGGSEQRRGERASRQQPGRGGGDMQLPGEVFVDRRLDFRARHQMPAAQRERGRVGIRRRPDRRRAPIAWKARR